MKKRLIICAISLVVLLPSVFSQIVTDNNLTENVIDLKTEKNAYKRKGKVYFFWGYNRSAYTKSDIHLWGDNHNFTIKDVKATDAPTTTFSTYVDPSSFSVPQYDWRIGYYITDKYHLSLGHSHMKYEISEQYVRMTGSIYDGELAGAYKSTSIKVGEGTSHEEDDAHVINEHEHEASSGESPSGFVPKLEHCDGINNFTLELGRTENLWASKNGKHCLSFGLSAGIGAAVTDTEANILGETDPNHDGGDEHAHELGADEHGGSWGGFHLAGYTTSLSTSIEIEFFNHFFIQTRLKGGYVNLTNFITTHDGGRGSQKFGFAEGFIAIGYTFYLTNK